VTFLEKAKSKEEKGKTTMPLCRSYLTGYYRPAKRVLVPTENERDLADVPDEVSGEMCPTETASRDAGRKG
jgi:hypothetical protein